MMVHERRARRCADRLLRRRARPRRDRAPGRAGRRCRSTSTRRRCRRSTSARPPAGCRAPRPGWSGRWSGSARCRSAELVGPGVRLAREGAPVNAEQAYILDILAPIHDRLAGTRELYAPRRAAPLREGDDVPLPGAGRGAGTLRRRGRGALLPRRGRGGAERVRARARRHSRPRRPRRLRGDRAASRSGRRSAAPRC